MTCFATLQTNKKRKITTWYVSADTYLDCENIVQKKNAKLRDEKWIINVINV